VTVEAASVGRLSGAPTSRPADAAATARAVASSPAVERLYGRPAVRARVRELMATARDEVALCLPDGPGAESGCGAAEFGGAGPASRSVRVRTLCSQQVRGDAGTLRRISALTDCGVAVRTVPSLSALMCLADRRQAVVQLKVDDHADEALAITDPALIAVVTSLFEAAWAASVPLTAETATGDAPATPQEHALLRLLSEGLTDEAAARKLGVSLRTERRMLTRLSQTLDAQSRFQLGQRAVQRGLL
jgi:DNA-binding CsgD family transcriptional regulator